ncbi:hypothetical protein [Labilibacter marinus]|uniref:hypothetical protein n=1 Tax=Labilibacter marinus TaxID=1477105 RepID=UPI00082B96E6|nr:hypothetical protein [Labilibacter marinus]
MANLWGIPNEVEKLVIKRDIKCVYCGIEFSHEKIPRKNKASWEHIINDIRLNREDNVALCCISCNASKGAKLIKEWFKSDYCKRKNISLETVSLVVRNVVLK